MQHRRYWWLMVGTFALVLMGARACGPDFGSAVFVVPDNPDNLKMYLDGQLAVLQPGFHTRHLVAAYRYLSGVPLTAEERKQFFAANEHYVNPASDGRDPYSDKPSTAVAGWLAARAAFGPVDRYTPDANSISTDRTLPGETYDSFANCLDAGFRTATATLGKRAAEHGGKSGEVTEWVRGQDAVFSNCIPGREFVSAGPDKRTPPPPPHAPAILPASAPLWLRQDRAYQAAAGHFYAMEFDRALTGFRGVAADTASPWSVTGRYMMARTLIRKATLTALSTSVDPNVGPTPAQTAAAARRLHDELVPAQAELRAMRGETRMAAMQDDIDALLDYVTIRLDPQADEVVLAQRFLKPGSARLKQSLIDFTVLHTTADEGNNIATITGPSGMQSHATHEGKTTDKSAEDLIAWVETLNSAMPATLENNRLPDAQAGEIAYAHWQAGSGSGHSSAWLAAALMLTAKPDAHTPELLSAGKQVRPSDPAYLTVAYHRLRLSAAMNPRDAATTRAEVLPLLAEAEHGQGPSAVNELKQVASVTAPTLNDWLATAGRVPAGETGEDSQDTVAYEMPKENVCGRAPVGYALFDLDAAVALNQQMPLRLLADAGESNVLPENLRFQVAQAAWARAVLLDEPAIAKRMSPILEGCRAAWKPVLDAYDAATTPVDRHALGLLALMRFASTEPSVREGDERRNGFASYDNLRQNWWCSTVPLPTETVDSSPAAWMAGHDPDSPYGSDPSALVTHPHAAPPPPVFLTADDMAGASREVSVLRAVPNASTYFAQQALAWFRQYPGDARTPEVLGEADRVLRNSCRHDQDFGKKAGPENTATLAHAVFDALHQRYPESVWAKKYKTWE